jgi:hypothetical protein
VEVGKSRVTVVLIAVFAVEVTVGGTTGFTLRLAFVGGDLRARCLRSRARACSGSTTRVSPLFQCRPGGRGILVGWKVARGSGEEGLSGMVHDGVTVAVMIFWVYCHLVVGANTVLVVVVFTGEG